MARYPRLRAAFASRAGAILTLILLAAALPAAAQTWMLRLAGDGADWPAAIARTADGGFVVAGATSSAGSGGLDGLVVRTDACGHVLWQYAYGGTGDDLFADVGVTDEGDLLLAGETDSFGERVDWWVVRLDGAGTVIWQRRYGGAGFDGAWGLTALADGGIAAVGVVEHPDDGDVDAGVLALEDDGTIRTGLALGGNADDALRCIARTPDGDLVAAGFSDRSGTGLFDAWVVRLDAALDVIWQSTYGGGGDDAAESVRALGNAVIVAGSTDSGAGGLTDHWVAALDPLGALIWQRRIGSADDDRGYAVAVTVHGDVLVAGDVVAGPAHPGHARDALVSRFDGAGFVLEHRAYGGTGDQDAVAVTPSRGGIVAAGADRVGADDDVWLLAEDLGAAACELSRNASEVGVSTTAFVPTSRSGSGAFAFATAPTSALRTATALSLEFACAVVPGEVSPEGAEPLRFSAAAVLTWEAGGPHCAETFNVYAGDLVELETGGNASCLVGSLPGHEATIDEAPGPGSARYYLVTGSAAGGEGPAGRSSAGVPRAIEAPCPL